MSETARKVLIDAILFTGDAFVESKALVIENNRVLDIISPQNIPPDAEVISCANQMIVPGFIDLQVNGGGNESLNQNPTTESVLKIALAHQRRGTTKILPTCITDSPVVRQKALNAVRKAKRQSNAILGIHFEGPFINPEKKGCHPAAFIHHMTDEEIDFFMPLEHEIMMMTLAPECVKSDHIHRLTHQGVIVSLGHSAACEDVTIAALETGAKGFTHLFNAMTGMTARAPGVAGCALDDPDSWCGLVADGHHVSDTMIRLAHRAKRQGKLFLVSDAMPPAGAETPHPFMLQEEEIIVKHGRCLNHEGRLAGSAITLADAVCHCVRHVGLDPAEVLRMASAYPADFLGIGKEYGRLLPGYVADYTVLGYDFLPQ